MALSCLLLVFAAACSEDAIPTSPLGPQQNQLVSRISISPSEALLQPDDLDQLEAQVISARGRVVNGREITWSSSDRSVVEIDPQGRIVAMNEGSATITAKHKDVVGSATVDVRGDVVEIIFAEVPDVAEGEAKRIEASYVYSNGAIRPATKLQWSTADRTIARIDGNGVVTGVEVGEVNVFAQARGQRGQGRIKVRKNETHVVEVESPVSRIELGESVELWAQVYDGRGRRLYKPVTWTSSSSSIARVDAYGVLTGVAIGSVTATASVDGVSGSVDVTVVASDDSGSSGGSSSGSGDSGSDDTGSSGSSSDDTGSSGSSSVANPGSVDDLSVDASTSSSLTISFGRVGDGTGSGAFYELRYGVAEKSWTWSTANIAQGECGAIPAGSPGTTASCTITDLHADLPYYVQVVAYREADGSRVYGELSNKAQGTTDQPYVVVDVVPSSFNLDVGTSKTLNASVTDQFGNPLSQSVTWTSTSSSVASVTSSGVATGNAAGNATIRATAGTSSGASSATVVRPATDDDTDSSGSTSGGSGSGGTSGPGWSPS
ncbi:MAG: Ig-like domain-containing protein, partial [Gemmatimonadota bacterium]|nr:Ig-like domain-containing protein [Gemmatimonadota bacterium]